jgi:anti-sigma factor RsiW
MGAAMERHEVEYEELIALAAGELSGDRRTEILRHLEGCPACAATVATFQTVREVVRADAVAAPSAAMLERVKRLAMPDAVTEKRSIVDAIRRVVASLVFDGRQPVAGLRGSASGHGLVYSAGDIDIDLRIEARPGGRFAVTGQIGLPDERSVRGVAFTSMETVEAPVDETGFFAIELDGGAYELLVRLDDEELVVPEVSIE